MNRRSCSSLSPYVSGNSADCRKAGLFFCGRRRSTIYIARERRRERLPGVLPMPKFISMRLAGPDDPIYRERLQSFSPHWARGFLGSRHRSPRRASGP
jgi:hypothetical protein